MVKQLEKKVTPEMEEKWSSYFDRRATYVGNGIYQISGLYSTDTRELFLMYIHHQEFQTRFD